MLCYAQMQCKYLLKWNFKTFQAIDIWSLFENMSKHQVQCAGSNIGNFYSMFTFGDGLRQTRVHWKLYWMIDLQSNLIEFQLGLSLSVLRHSEVRLKRIFFWIYVKVKVGILCKLGFLNKIYKLSKWEHKMMIITTEVVKAINAINNSSFQNQNSLLIIFPTHTHSSVKRLWKQWQRSE